MNEKEKQNILNQAQTLNDDLKIENEYDHNLKDIKECPECKTKIRFGVFKGASMYEKVFVDLINMFNEEQQEYYCTNCGEKKLIDAKKKISDKNFSIGCKLQNIIDYIPVVTIQNPKDWDYEIVDMVTAQNTTGTGVFFELSTSIDDIMGGKSEKYNSKTKEGERICKQMLRVNALQLGANAVIGTDIDYTEVGGSKALFMICMAGTAVRVKNIEILGEAVKNAYAEYDNAKVELEKINRIIKIIN